MIEVELAGESLVLLPERAMFWPRRRVLFVADLHWGKREAFVVEGIPLPDGVLRDDLGRLEALIDRHRVERVVVLGDLIHNRAGITDAVVEQVAEFRARGPEMWLIRGNHDRHLPRLPQCWRIDEHEDRLEPPFVYTHVPRVDPGGYVVAGHVHPALRLRTRGDGLRVPCFHLGPTHAVLPAFSAFTGGAVVTRAPGDRAFAIAGDRVIEV